MKKNPNRLGSLLIILLLLVSGCGGDYRDPAVTDADITTLMQSVQNHPAIKTMPSSEVGSIYDDGDSWRIELHRPRRSKPVLWFRVDKATKKATLIE